jgi:hypothetical protein
LKSARLPQGACSYWQGIILDGDGWAYHFNKLPFTLIYVQHRCSGAHFFNLSRIRFTLIPNGLDGIPGCFTQLGVGGPGGNFFQKRDVGRAAGFAGF